jgi:hypothetical protein
MLAHPSIPRTLFAAVLLASLPILADGSDFRPLASFSGDTAIPGSPAFGNGFGQTVHLHPSKNFLFVASPVARPDGKVVGGAVYVYRKQGRQWLLNQTITTGGTSDHLGGFRIEANGKWLFISAIGTPLGPINPDTVDQQDLTGAIQIYKLDDDSNQWQFHQSIDRTTPGLEELTPSSSLGLNVTVPAFLVQQGASFGLNFSLDRPHGQLLVGAQYQQHTDPLGAPQINSGTVYAFRYAAGDDQWVLTQRITNPEGTSANDTFGANLVLDGDLALISNASVVQIPRLAGIIDPARTNGTVYVYQRMGGQWTYVQKLNGDQPGPAMILSPTVGPCGIEDAFGSSLALDHGWAVIGAGLEQAAPGGRLGGAVYFYDVQEQCDQKTLVRKPKAVSNDPNTQGTALLGLSLKDDVLLVSDPLHAGPAGEARQGAVLVFQRSRKTWALTNTLFDPQGGAGQYFGFSVTQNEELAAGGSGAFVSSLLFASFGSPIIPMSTTQPVANGHAALFDK